jgi:mono/diheme cytochrome c family protein
VSAERLGLRVSGVGLRGVAGVRVARVCVGFGLLMGLAGCSWFTDFKEQPKIDPWDTPADSIPPRANPQGSVPITGSAAPEFMYSRARTFPAHEAMGGISNPVPVDSSSVSRGRVLYQINCAVCHGASGEGGAGTMVAKYSGFTLIGAAVNAGSKAAEYADGRLYGVIRNGSAIMPSYARLEDRERWDIVNYMRALQGKLTFPIDTSHGRPGETGAYVPGASNTAPTRPAPFYPPQGSKPLHIATPPAAAGHGGAATHVPPDTTKGGPQ